MGLAMERSAFVLHKHYEGLVWTMKAFCVQLYLLLRLWIHLARVAVDEDILALSSEGRVKFGLAIM